MKRFAVIGALVLLLALVGGPAFAQVGEGSVLPDQGPAQVLPASASRPAASVTQPAPALADTGIELSNGMLLATGLFVVGGVALTAGRRRVTR